MASTQRRTAVTLANKLFAYPQGYDFYQAVRLLKALNFERAAFSTEAQQRPMGYDHAQAKEVINFGADPALRQPQGEITQLTDAQFNAEKKTFSPIKMQVSFMGLTGPSGVLPMHYSEMILAQIRAKDFAMRDFFDLFNHRTISFYYRSFEKYRIEYNFEEQRRQGHKTDTLTKVLKQLTGLPLHETKTTLTPDHLLFYTGLFAQQRRSVNDLKNLLADYFQVPIAIKQFVGRWNLLQESECTRLPSLYKRRLTQKTQFNSLGKNTILGKRVWYSQGKFRIIIGPLNSGKFKEFLPGTRGLQQLKALTHEFVGNQFNFDIQLISEPAATPPCRLSRKQPPQLGYFTWLRTKNAEVQHDKLVIS